MSTPAASPEAVSTVTTVLLSRPSAGVEGKHLPTDSRTAVRPLGGGAGTELLAALCAPRHPVLTAALGTGVTAPISLLLQQSVPTATPVRSDSVRIQTQICLSQGFALTLQIEPEETENQFVFT